jgi:acetyl esterase
MFKKLKAMLLRWFYRWANRRAWKGIDFGIVTVQEGSLPGPAGELAIRIYRPDDPPRALIVYLHGGGWVIGDLESHDPFCRQLTRETETIILAVDYRLAPEHPYPAAAEDAIAAVRWALAHKEELGAADLKVFVAGDSAGANLSTAVARELAGDPNSELAGQCLIYPATRFHFPNTESHLDNATGYGLTLGLMKWFWSCYTPTAGKTLSHEQAPMAVFVDAPVPAGMAPALVITAELDPLRDEGKEYADALNAGGVACRYEYFPEQMHGFVCSEGITAAHHKALDHITEWMEDIVRQPAPTLEEPQV